MKYRTEIDSMGEVMVPEDAYYGAQTQRAVENFSISGLRFPRSFIGALGVIKKSAAQANLDLGLLDAELAEAIITAATRSRGRQTGRSICGGCLPDRFRDIHQYECKRGDCRPCK